MTSLYDEAARKAREEVLKLVSVSVDIIPADKYAEIKADNPDFTPRAQMTVVWEPMSYRKEGGKRGNTESDFLQMSFGLTEEQVENVRQAFYRGIPNDRRMTIPKSLGQAKQPWERWMLKAREAGLKIDIGEDGNFVSPSAGQLFRVEAGFDTFPTFKPNENGKRGGRWTDPNKGEDGRDFYMRYPIENVTASYVQPDDVPVRIVNDSDDGEDKPAAVTSSAGGAGGIRPAALAAALTEIGVVGSPATSFSTANQQMEQTSEGGGSAPILFASEVQSHAGDGTLLDWAVSIGAVEIDADGIVRSVA